MRMPEKSKIQVSSICLIATLFCVFSPTSTAASKPWEAAAEVYNASLKLYKLNQWQDALAALQGFVEDFPTNENVPLAYLQIASCYNFMHKDDEELKILEKITKEFPDTMAAFYAWSTIYYDKFKKAQEVKSQAESGKFSKEFKDFVLFLENMEKQFGGLFIAPINQIHWPVISDYYWHYSPGRITWWPYYEVLGYEIELYPLNGWNYWTTRFPDQRMTQSILTLAKNPAMAEELLRVLQPCFRKLDDDLPACWKMMHVQLLEKGRGGEKAAQAQLAKYEAYYKKGDPMGIPLKVFELKVAWDNKKMDLVKEISNYLADNFMGYHDLYQPFSRWMDYLYASGDNQEFIRLSKMYMDKTPEGGWESAILDRWVNLAARGVVKPEDAVALIDANQTYYPENMCRVSRNLMRKIDIYQSAKSTSEAVKAMTMLLSREMWSKENFNWADRKASSNKELKSVVDKTCEQFGIAREKPGSSAKAVYDDLRRRISQKQDRFVEELAMKLYTEYRPDYYTIMGIYNTVKFFYDKAAHQQRNKWADIMVNSYPFNPLTQEVVQYQINAADAAKDFEMLAKWTSLGLKNFPSATHTDKWIELRLYCFDPAKEIQNRAAYAKTLLQKRADTGEPQAVRMLGTYECQTMNTWKQHATYWLSRAGKYKGKYAETVCNHYAWVYGYREPYSRWQWSYVDFDGAARGMTGLAEQNYRPDWKWKTMFDDVNVLAMGGKGTMAMQILMKKLPDVKYAADIHKRLDLPNLGYACGKDKMLAKSMGMLSRVKGMVTTAEGKMTALMMLANACRFNGGQGQVAAKTYVAAAAYYKRPVMKWQLMIMAYQCSNRPEQITLFNSYASQMKNALDRRPWLISCVGLDYIAEKNLPKAKAVLGSMLNEYKASTYTGQLAEALLKASAKSKPTATTAKTAKSAGSTKKKDK